MKKLFIILREYLTYITRNPRLIFQIPQRFFEEFLLYARYIVAKHTKTYKNVALIRQLQAMRTDLRGAPTQYKPALTWEKLFNQFERVLYIEDISNFKTQRYNDNFSNYKPTNPRFYTRFLWVYWNNIKKRDTLHLLDTLEEPRVGNGLTYAINGKRLSYDLLQSIDEFYTLNNALPRNKGHIIGAELGAGYGRLGYAFLNALPKSTYIIIDLPGSLIIAQYYLSKLFPKNMILTYEASKKIRTFDRRLLTKYRLVFMAPWQLPNLVDKSLDLFINIYSFQEMMPTQIENYFAIIDKKCRGIFYSKQQYIAENLKNQVILKKSDYPMRKHWKKILDRPSTIAQDIFETIYHV